MICILFTASLTGHPSVVFMTFLSGINATPYVIYRDVTRINHMRIKTPYDAHHL